MMLWNEVVENEIWICENFLSNETAVRITDAMLASTNKNLHNTDVMSQKLAKIGINNNSYDYVIYQYDIRKDLDIIGEIADSLDQVLARFGQSAPRQKLNAMQCFVKSFSSTSHYDVHVESYEKYGHWAWIHFLSDENSGELVFPDAAMLEAYLAENPHQRSTYADNVRLLATFEESTRLVGPFVMKPRYNQCILFRTGSAHWANPIDVANGMTRPTATGWPHASQIMLDDLNRNCNINENFGHS